MILEKFVGVFLGSLVSSPRFVLTRMAAILQIKGR